MKSFQVGTVESGEELLGLFKREFTNAKEMSEGMKENNLWFFTKESEDTCAEETLMAHMIATHQSRVYSVNVSQVQEWQSSYSQD